MKKLLSNIKTSLIYGFSTMIFLGTLVIGLKLYEFLAYVIASGLWHTKEFFLSFFV